MSMCCILTISLRDSANDSTTSAGSDIDSESRTLILQNLSEEQINSYSKFNQKKQFTENICIFGDYKAFRASERHYLKMN